MSPVQLLPPEKTGAKMDTCCAALSKLVNVMLLTPSTPVPGPIAFAWAAIVRVMLSANVRLGMTSSTKLFPAAWTDTGAHRY